MKLNDFLERQTLNVNESIRNRDIDKACELIDSFLTKNKVYICKKLLIPFIKNGKRLFGMPAFNDKGWGVMFCWDMGHSSYIDSILFTKKFDEMMYIYSQGNKSFTWEIDIECKGASITKCCYLISDVMNGKIEMDITSINGAIDDARIWENNNFPATEYNYSLKDILEGYDDPSLIKLDKQRGSLYRKIRRGKIKGIDISDLQNEYDEIDKKFRELKTKIKKNSQTQFVEDKEINDIEKKFEDNERATPQERFDDMKSYIYNVVAGIRPLAIICGAPGVGKTYRIMKIVKETGKEPLIDYGLIKGKCTTQAFYMMLHDYKEEGNLVILDDADEVLKNDVNINLIKAAADSSDERIVTYITARPPEMTEEKAVMCDDAVFKGNKWYYPTEFEFKGSLIIITNMGAGMIDTAIKNRALMCDLDFTIDEILKLIEDLVPIIKPDTLTAECKKKAMNYLRKMASLNMPMEISIRSFTLVAGLYNTSAPEKDIERRIREQMRLQFDRKKSKY